MAERKDFEIWESWKNTGNPSDLGKLLHQYDGMIQQSVNRYDNPNIPRTALEGEAKHQAFVAFDTFDPKFGTQLSTHVGNRLRKLFSYVSKYQNIGKIPEGEISSISTYKLAKEDLRKKFKREPSVPELSDYLAWSINRVSKMEASLRGDYIASGDLQDLPSFESNPQFERMRFAYYDMTPEESQVFDYITGSHGKEKLTPGRIAEKMGISNSKVSSIKNRVAERMEIYGG